MTERKDWPQEIARERTFGNFRQTETEEAKPAKSWRDKRPGMDPGHLANVRKLPCIVCGQSEHIEAHHLKSGKGPKGERGISLKATDKWALPLCKPHHHELEQLGSRREVEWFEGHGVTPHVFTEALWNAKHNFKQMQAIWAAHRQRALEGT